jgi:ribonuclease BN (tRNA processing enzyme)
MRLTVLGGAGGWPPAGGACSGYLIEQDGFRLLVDPGYAIVPRLLEIVPAEAIDAVLVSHGHPDHVADLNPLLRARLMRDDASPRLPAYALPDALGRVLALDQITALKDACEVRGFEAGDAFPIGPFEIESRPLPHSIPNAGLRISAGGLSITYTGDAGPSDDLVDLAGDTDLLLAEATYVDSVPSGNASVLNSALEVGRQARRARAARLMLTHLLPGTDPEASLVAASRSFSDWIGVATSGTVVELSTATI